MSQGRTVRPVKIVPRAGDVAPLKRDIPAGDGNYRNRKLLDLSRDEACSNCGALDGSTVPVHSNLGAHGKGRGIKAHDCFVADLCDRCHRWLDQAGTGRDPTNIYQPTREDKCEMFMRAMHRTWLNRWIKGKLKVSA